MKYADQGVSQERALLDQLLDDARLYRSSSDYQELLHFIVQLRNVAPFNAMLLQIQKPGVRHVASAFDWRTRFGRAIREGARPLLILWPFGPVATVYDVHDTVGPELPQDVRCFPAHGPIDAETVQVLRVRLATKNIRWIELDAGDGEAGWIRVDRRAARNDTFPTTYALAVNREHPPATQFVTIAHELAHVYLGHLGADKDLHAPDRTGMSHQQREIEAESVAFLVAGRSGVKAKSQSYLAAFVSGRETVDNIDLYQITRAAGQIESLLQRTAHTSFGPRSR
jgi:hypothetical protein